MKTDREQVVDHFNNIAPAYDRLNRIISWGQDQKWRFDLARRMSPKPSQMILDISAGTGDMEPAIKAACSSVRVVGLDPSPSMTGAYRQKMPDSVVTLGVAEKLPFRAGMVDGAVCTFGVRNFMDRATAFAEIYRVLKPGGFWGFLEMSPPGGVIFPIIYGLYFKRVVPLLGALFSSRAGAYRYLRDSVYQFPGRQGMTAEHQTAGFTLHYYRAILNGAVGLYIFQKKSI